MKKEQNTITVKEAASSLGVSEMTVYRMLQAGKLNAFKRLVNRHHQSFIRIDEKWRSAFDKRHHITWGEPLNGMKKDLETSAGEYADKAEAASRNAADKAEYARVQAIEALNASDNAQRCCDAARTVMEDTARYRAHAANSVSKAKEEARSAMRCVVWCFCAAILSLLFLIAHFIL